MLVSYHDHENPPRPRALPARQPDPGDGPRAARHGLLHVTVYSKGARTEIPGVLKFDCS